MLSPEYFIPSDDIDNVLAYQLIPLDAGGTEKFEVDGYPDLYVRREESAARMLQANRGYMNLRLQGVDVLPYASIQRSEGHYTITYRVDGEPLEELIGAGRVGTIANDIDSHYARTGRYILGAWQDGMLTATDVVGPQQCMYGSVKGSSPGIKFVDIDMRAGIIPSYPGELTKEAIDIANDVIRAEASLEGRALTMAREIIQRLFDIDFEKSPDDAYVAALVNMGKTMLKDGMQTDDHYELDVSEIIGKW